jgi:hypothetical protein
MTTTTYEVQLTDSPGSMTADVVHIEATSERAAGAAPGQNHSRHRLAMTVDDAMVERLRASLWATWGKGRQTTDWPTHAQLHQALIDALADAPVPG